MGATGYDVERAPSAAGPWTQIGYNVSDADVPYFPLFNDEGAAIGSSYYYRVSAINGAGISPASNVVGPVKVSAKLKLDTMANLGQTETSTGVTAVSGEDRSFKEIRSRLAGDPGAQLIYSVPGRFKSFDLYAFEKTAAANLQILGSADGKKWDDLKVAPQSFANAETNYDYWIPKLYRTNANKPLKFIKIVFKGGAAQLARAELTYTDK